MNDLTKDTGYEVLSEPVRHAKCSSWTISGSMELEGIFQSPSNNLPLASFNHISREVISLEKSKYFYVNILGFQVIPRPPFDSPGYWLYGYGLSVHLITTTRPAEWRGVVYNRISSSSKYLPRVDHIAFITHGMDQIRNILDEAKIYYKYDEPKGTGIRQIFLFDPDGNVIEVSNCQPPVGLIKCIQTSSIDYALGWLHSDITTYIASNKDTFSSSDNKRFINPDSKSPLDVVQDLGEHLKRIEVERDSERERAKRLEQELAELKRQLKDPSIFEHNNGDQ